MSTDISTDVRVNKLALECGDFAVLLYTWLIPHAKDDASLPTSDYEELLFTVIPARRDKDANDVRIAIEGMVRVGLLEYANDQLRFPTSAFYRYQTYVSDKHRKTPQKATSLSLSPSPLRHMRKCESDKVKCESQWKEFWEGYPRKVDKILASKAWDTRMGEGVDPALLLACSKNYALTRVGEDVKYTMRPATFLGPNQRYADYEKEPEVDFDESEW